MGKANKMNNNTLEDIETLLKKKMNNMKKEHDNEKKELLNEINKLKIENKNLRNTLNIPTFTFQTLNNQQNDKKINYNKNKITFNYI